MTEIVSDLRVRFQMHNFNLSCGHLSQGCEDTTRKQGTRVVTRNWIELHWMGLECFISC